MNGDGTHLVMLAVPLLSAYVALCYAGWQRVCEAEARGAAPWAAVLEGVTWVAVWVILVGGLLVVAVGGGR